MAVESGRNITIAISSDGTNTTSTTWLTIGQQRAGSVERTSETADATHKGTSGGWATAAFTRKTWSISFDGVLDNTDAGWDKGKTEAAGFLRCKRYIRPPHHAMREEDIIHLRKIGQKYFQGWTE